MVEKLKEFNVLFGNEAAPKAPVPDPKAELSKRRLGARDLELIGG